jgi:hypothetical protein
VIDRQLEPSAERPRWRSRLTRAGPLAGRYPAAAAMVVFALVPYLALSIALQRLAPIIAKRVHMSTQAMTMTVGMANAGYAIGNGACGAIRTPLAAPADAAPLRRATGNESHDRWIAVKGQRLRRSSLADRRHRSHLRPLQRALHPLALPVTYR